MAKARHGDPGRKPEEELAEIADDMEEVDAVSVDDELGAEGDEESMLEAQGDLETQGEIEDTEQAEAAATGEWQGEAEGRRQGATVADFMTPDPRTVTPETSIEEAARLFAMLDSGALPVVESDEDQTPIGMVTDRDIVTRILAHGDNPFDLTVADCMTTPALTIGIDDDVEDAVRIFEQSQVRRAIVVDDDGQCCGILAQADLAFAVDDELVAEMLRAVSRPSEEPAHIPG